MHFAYPFPWWLAALLGAAVSLAVVFQYRRTLSPLTAFKRGVLTSLRSLTLVLLVVFLFRPIILLPPQGAHDAVVPVLVDVSRSMGLNDADGQARLDRAKALLKASLLPALAPNFTTELYSVGGSVAPAVLDDMHANARQTDLTGALAAIRERYRGQRVAGVVLLSDGGDTGQLSSAAAADAGGLPVFAIGMGSPEGFRDREVLAMTAGDPRLDQASVDLHVTAISSGFGRAPFQVRILANGRLLETRRVIPIADGSPVDLVFTVSPDRAAPTVYTAEIPKDDSELVDQNNTRSVLVSPPGRKRRLLVLEGAPGFEHSFMTRAWTHDPVLEVDSITRKGRNGEGVDTFFVQAGAGRGPELTGGFPPRRELLYGYDAVVIANVEGDFFTHEQLAMTADFVAERGGGLLVLGGRSFSQRGLAGSALEEALPVELNDRRGGLVRTSLGAGELPAHNKVSLTPEGETHPIMRVGASPDETVKLWAGLPALAASAALGTPRPGATVLAVTTAPSGAVYPVVAVQRYGQGRSMVFGGEASWRWKMLVASTDRSYDLFWRQAARWLASSAPDPVAITVPAQAEPEDTIPVDLDARDRAFAPVPDAEVEATITAPAGTTEALKMRRSSGASGRFTSSWRPNDAGLYHIQGNARQGSTSLGAADRWLLVGGADREFVEPRLNEGFLRRVARNSGGHYFRGGEVHQVPALLRAVVPQNPVPERRDLWHEPWAFAIIILMLCMEWILRRRWGLR